MKHRPLVRLQGGFSLSFWHGKTDFDVGNVSQGLKKVIALEDKQYHYLIYMLCFFTIWRICSCLFLFEDQTMDASFLLGVRASMEPKA